MHKIAMFKMWSKTQEGERELKYTTLCNLPDILKLITPQNGKIPVQRGENESTNLHLPCESPRHLEQNMNIITTFNPVQRGENESIHNYSLL